MNPVVAFAECDGALSCTNITLRRLDNGRSSSQGSSTDSSSTQYALEVNLPSGTRMGPTMMLSIIPAQIIRPPPPYCRRGIK